MDCTRASHIIKHHFLPLKCLIELRKKKEPETEALSFKALDCPFGKFVLLCGVSLFSLNSTPVSKRSNADSSLGRHNDNRFRFADVLPILGL